MRKLLIFDAFIRPHSIALLLEHIKPYYYMKHYYLYKIFSFLGRYFLCFTCLSQMPAQFTTPLLPMFPHFHTRQYHTHFHLYRLYRQHFRIFSFGSIPLQKRERAPSDIEILADTVIIICFTRRRATEYPSTHYCLLILLES